MCDPDTLQKLLRAVRGHAVDYFGNDLEKVILYGSYARKDADDESDVDIMILVRQTREQLALARKAWNRFGTGLDLEYNVLTSFQLQDSETFEQWKHILPFYQNVLREGVVFDA